MEKTQLDKAKAFQEMHQRPAAFVIANAWDGGSARVLTGLGFEAIATSSGAFAGTLGRRDGKVTRDEALAHARLVVSVTDLPVAADLEGGFGDAPEAVAETIRRAAQTGLVGGSIEDHTGDRDQPIYDIGLATERIEAAVEAARALPFKFTLTARSENFLRGKPDLKDTIRRLQAFERAGADVLFAPCLPSLAAVREVCSSVGKPVNFMIGMPGTTYTIAALKDAGVKRISVATSLYRAAMNAMVEAAREIREQGTFTYVERPASVEINKFML